MSDIPQAGDPEQEDSGVIDDLTLGIRLAALPADLGMLIIQNGATLDYRSAHLWSTVSKMVKKWSVPP